VGLGMRLAFALPSAIGFAFGGRWIKAFAAYLAGFRSTAPARQARGGDGIVRRYPQRNQCRIPARSNVDGRQRKTGQKPLTIGNVNWGFNVDALSLSPNSCIQCPHAYSLIQVIPVGVCTALLPEIKFPRFA